MLHTVKRRLYFVFASYFGFWAKFVLRRWRPQVVVITGSTGKTTVLHLVEAQLGDQAVYSHHANSALGVPFHILGLPSNVTSKSKWLGQVLRAPFASLRKAPATKLYVVEADCDRPKEGRFLSQLLKPDVTLWVSVFKTHTMNFDHLVPGQFASYEQAIAHEFGNFVEATKSLVLANGDQPELVEQLDRAQESVKVVKARLSKLTNFNLTDTATSYTIDGQQLTLQGFHPRELANGLQMVTELLRYLDKPLDPDFKKLELPPGRSSMFKGQHSTTIIDSTYNTGLGAMIAILGLFDEYKHTPKWLVLGDILEQGEAEKSEHEAMADEIIKVKPDHVVLLGPRTHQYTYPILQTKLKVPVVSFDSPKEVLEYLQKNLKGGEAVLFKGGRFLEGVIEQLLADPSEAELLVRREPSWVKTRRQWGLPR